MHLYDDVDQRLSQVVGVEARSIISTRHGVDRQYNGLMSLAKAQGCDPMDMAETVATKLRHDPTFETVTAATPGFVNLRLSEAAILAAVSECQALTLPPNARQRVIIDFGGPNIAKALHIGHLRSLVIGESLRRILLARGHHVVSDIHFGDWGLPMGMLIAEVLHSYPGFPDKRPVGFGHLLERLYPEAVREASAPDRLLEAHVVASGLQAGELDWVWKVIREESLAVILPQIRRLDAHFDLLLGESDAQPYLATTLKALREHARTDAGATVIDVATPIDAAPMPPLIFQKADLSYTYAATDLATIMMRRQFPNTRRRRTDRIIYVVDKRQALHFEQLFRAARKMMDIELVHVGFGTVNGLDGKPFRSRDGGTPRLEDVLDAAVTAAIERMNDPDLAEMIGIGALKYADLVTHRESGYVFDLDRFLAVEGKTGPYVQYACVRLRRLLEAAEDQKGPVMIELPIEREILLTCANFPEIVGLAESKLLPNYVAEYAFTLAQVVSRFYQSCEVLRAESPLRESRLTICGIAHAVLTRCLTLLGIKVPEAM
jgi:arginyl-tRNA synthetase